MIQLYMYDSFTYIHIYSFIYIYFFFYRFFSIISYYKMLHIVPYAIQ